MVNSDLYDLIEPNGSALDRTLARCRETSILTDAIVEWISSLKTSEAVFNQWDVYPDVPSS